MTRSREGSTRCGRVGARAGAANASSHRLDASFAFNTFCTFILSTLALKAITLGMFAGCGFRNFEECASGVREAAAFSIDEAQLALKVELLHRDVNQLALANSLSTLMRGTSATPFPMATKRLIACSVGSSIAMCRGVL